MFHRHDWRHCSARCWLCCHYPLATWPHFERTISIFGHIHSGPRSENAVDIPGKDLILTKKQYDAGVDNNDYRPVDLLTIYRKLGF